MYDGVNKLEEIRAERRKRLLPRATVEEALERLFTPKRKNATGRKRTNKRGSGKERRAGEGTKT